MLPFLVTVITKGSYIPIPIRSVYMYEKYTNLWSFFNGKFYVNRPYAIHTVDGSEIQITCDGAKTRSIMRFQLPTSPGERRISEPSTVDQI